jgi:hypothetical protein
MWAIRAGARGAPDLAALRAGPARQRQRGPASQLDVDEESVFSEPAFRADLAR